MASRLQMFASLPRCILLSLTVLSAAACIPIPYKPGSTVSKGDFIETPPTQSVRYVEGEVVTTLAKKIQSRDKEIVVVAHKDLEAIAFPEGDINLDQLLEPDRRGRLRQDYGLSYLVLIGDLTTTEDAALPVPVEILPPVPPPPAENQEEQRQP